MSAVRAVYAARSADGPMSRPATGGSRPASSCGIVPVSASALLSTLRHASSAISAAGTAAQSCGASDPASTQTAVDGARAIAARPITTTGLHEFPAARGAAAAKRSAKSDTDRTGAGHSEGDTGSVSQKASASGIAWSRAHAEHAEQLAALLAAVGEHDAPPAVDNGTSERQAVEPDTSSRLDGVLATLQRCRSSLAAQAPSSTSSLAAAPMTDETVLAEARLASPSASACCNSSTAADPPTRSDPNRSIEQHAYVEPHGSTAASRHATKVTMSTSELGADSAQHVADSVELGADSTDDASTILRECFPAHISALWEAGSPPSGSVELRQMAIDRIAEQLRTYGCPRDEVTDRARQEGAPTIASTPMAPSSASSSMVSSAAPSLATLVVEVEAEAQAQAQAQAAALMRRRVRASAGGGADGPVTTQEAEAEAGMAAGDKPEVLVLCLVAVCLALYLALYLTLCLTQKRC